MTPSQVKGIFKSTFCLYNTSGAEIFRNLAVLQPPHFFVLRIRVLWYRDVVSDPGVFIFCADCLEMQIN